MAMSKPAKKISLVDRYAIGAALEVAAVAVDPDESSYRVVFREIMPRLYVMRQRGMSFQQIHRHIHQAGFPIALSTLRTYYSACLVEMRQECERHFRKLDRVINGVGKTAEVDRMALRAARTAVCGAAMAEGKTRAAAAIKTFAGAGNVAGEPPPSPAPETREAAASPLSHKPSTGLELPTEALARGKPQQRVGAPGIAPDTPSCVTTAARQVLRPLSAADASGSPHCLTTPGEAQIKVCDDLPPEVLSEDLLEHPAIAALMLTRVQRFFTGRLEYRDAAGVLHLETGKEMVSRREWTPPVPPSVGRTSGDFVELDPTIIGRRKTS
jgi:hypothetical protein